MLLTDDLDQHSLTAVPVEFVIENMLPRPQVEFAVGDCNNHLPAHDLPLVVGIRIVFSRAILQVATLGRMCPH